MRNAEEGVDGGHKNWDGAEEGLDGGDRNCDGVEGGGDDRNSLPAIP